jgi:uncharacterized protein (TIGR03437 family)
VDIAGNLYIADSLNNRIRKVSSGVITTIAGNGTAGFSGDNGPATSAQLNLQTGFADGIAVDSAGNLFIVDEGNDRIRRVSSGVITTIAGTGTAGFNGDNGLATSAQLNKPTGVAVDSTGKVYVADSANLRVRLLTPTGPSVPSLTAVTNAASNLGGPIAPGEIVVITGSGLGPTSLVAGFIADPAVTFDGVPATLIYAEAVQIAASVPGEVAGKTSTLVQVHYKGQLVSAAVVPVAAAAPGLFTLEGSGSGQGAILNQDGSANSPGNAAAKGSTVSLFATGTGASQPSIVVGINSEGSTVISAAPVPGLIGVIQIDVQVPNDAPTGSSIPVVIEAGGAFSQPGVTIAIQ